VLLSSCLFPAFSFLLPHFLPLMILTLSLPIPFQNEVLAINTNGTSFEWPAVDFPAGSDLYAFFPFGPRPFHGLSAGSLTFLLHL
jgi:hypothetical protein